MEQRQLDERRLREEVLAGDENAWRSLYSTYFRPIYAYVYVRTGGNVAETEDLVQDCWMVAVRRIKSFDPDKGNFGAWLLGIAEKVMLNRRRRAGRTQAAMVDALRTRREPRSPAQGIATADAVGAGLAALPEAYREVLLAKYEDGLSVAEIAGRRGSTPKAVESLLTRARNAFKKVYGTLNSEPANIGTGDTRDE